MHKVLPFFELGFGLVDTKTMAREGYGIRK